MILRVGGLAAVLVLFWPHLAPPAAPPPTLITGMASYYGWQHEGRVMADGHRFRALGFTAASRTLPLGSRIRVTSVATGRSVVVRVTDRGPYVGKRILDLSLGAARMLHMVKAGVARVTIEVL